MHPSIPGMEEEDGDSLFGTPSPPSSPRSGRSSSPALALPSSGSSTQNVGTIALPGSHPNSEHAINPALLMLSHPQIQQQPYVPKPPTRVSQPNLSYAPSATSVFSQLSAVPNTQSVVSEPYYSTRRQQPEREREKRKKKVPATRPAAPRAPPPPIHLPDPDAPVPPNFLRNQAALLGTAGLVSGVLPSRLSIARHTRGKTSENPIVVEDENDPGLSSNRPTREIPSLSDIRSISPNNPPTLTMFPLPEVDPALLPQPTNAEIVAVLIMQQNIFPVLENILRLIAAGASNSSTSNSFFTPQVPLQQQTSAASSQNINRSAEPSAPKRRKLNKVPAGAADWDVPYPFQDGEGPQEYRNNWQKERGRQLIAQLVAIIKIAARKAATKRYLEEQEALRIQLELRQKSVMEGENDWNVLVNGHYRLSTAGYSGAIPYSASTPTIPPTPAAAVNEGTSPFDSLIASLLAAGTPASPTTANSTSSTEQQPPDQAIYNDWMSIFNTFSASESSTTTNTSERNQQSLNNHFSAYNVPPSIDSIMDMPIFGQGDIEVPPINTSVDDTQIDPALLALSADQGVRERSVSSVATTPGPATPASAGWEIGSDVAIMNGPGNSSNSNSQGSGQLGGMISPFSFTPAPETKNIAHSLYVQLRNSRKGKNAPKEEWVVDETGVLRLSAVGDGVLPLPTATVYATTSSSTGPRLLLSPPGGLANASSSYTAPAPRPRPARLRATPKEKAQQPKRSTKDIRTLAMKKRALLAAELERAASEYWEVQLEHSALVELAKDPLVVNGQLVRPPVVPISD